MAYELSWDIAHSDRAWHELEKQLAADAKKAGQPDERFVDIVDVDVLPRHDNPVAFVSRSEVRDAYEGFLDDPRLEEAPSKDFIRKRLSAQLYHLNLLEGAETDVFRHLETAMGSEPVLVDERVIDRHQEVIEKELGKHGLGFDKSYAEAFQERLGLPRGSEAMRRHLTVFARRTGALVVGEKPEDSLAIPEIVSVDAGWVGYFSTDETGKPFTQLNAHKRHGYTRGRAAAIAAHEAAGHAMDFAHKHQAISRGQMDPIFGITTVFTPENVTAETIALGREQQSLRSVEGQDAWEYHFQADYHDYSEMVWNNALIHINTGCDEAEVLKYLQSRSLPYEKLENMQGRLREMRGDPAMRANSGAYEPAMRVVRLLLNRPIFEQERFFQAAGNYPYDEHQMHNLLQDQTPLKF